MKSLQELSLNGVGQHTFIFQAPELFGFRNLRSQFVYNTRRPGNAPMNVTMENTAYLPLSFRQMSDFFDPTAWLQKVVGFYDVGGSQTNELCLGLYSKMDLQKTADVWPDTRNIHNVRQMQASLLWGNKLALRSAEDEKRAIDDILCILSYVWMNEGHSRRELSLKYYARDIVGQITLLNLKG